MWHHSRSEVKEGGDEDETANRCTHTAQRVPASTENEKENMELRELKYQSVVLNVANFKSIVLKLMLQFIFLKV